jgi:hypothetical protein
MHPIQEEDALLPNDLIKINERNRMGSSDQRAK